MRRVRPQSAPGTDFLHTGPPVALWPDSVRTTRGRCAITCSILSTLTFSCHSAGVTGGSHAPAARVPRLQLHQPLHGQRAARLDRGRPAADAMYVVFEAPLHSPSPHFLAVFCGFNRIRVVRRTAFGSGLWLPATHIRISSLFALRPSPSGTRQGGVGAHTSGHAWDQPRRRVCAHGDARAERGHHPAFRTGLDHARLRPAVAGGLMDAIVRVEC